MKVRGWSQGVVALLALTAGLWSVESFSQGFSVRVGIGSSPIHYRAGLYSYHPIRSQYTSLEILTGRVADRASDLRYDLEAQIERSIVWDRYRTSYDNRFESDVLLWSFRQLENAAEYYEQEVSGEKYESNVSCGVYGCQNYTDHSDVDRAYYLLEQAVYNAYNAKVDYNQKSRSLYGMNQPLSLDVEMSFERLFDSFCSIQNFYHKACYSPWRGLYPVTYRYVSPSYSDWSWNEGYLPSSSYYDDFYAWSWRTTYTRRTVRRHPVIELSHRRNRVIESTPRYKERVEVIRRRRGGAVSRPGSTRTEVVSPPAVSRPDPVMRRRSGGAPNGVDGGGRRSPQVGRPSGNVSAAEEALKRARERGNSGTTTTTRRPEAVKRPEVKPESPKRTGGSNRSTQVRRRRSGGGGE